MFKKYYKEANDDIKPDRELIDKIFERAEMPATRGRVHKFAGSAVALAAVIALSICSYPQLVRFAEGGRLAETSVERSADKEKSADGESENKNESAKLETEKNSGEISASDAKPKFEGANTEESVPEARKNGKATARSGAFAASDTAEKSTPERSGAAVFGSADSTKTDGAGFDGEMNGAEAASAQSAELEVSVQSDEGASVTRALGGSSATAAGPSRAESLRDELAAIARLPEDMEASDCGTDENGTAFASFEGEGTRRIKLLLSENADPAENADAEFERNGVRVAIFAHEITADEMKALVESISE